MKPRVLANIRVTIANLEHPGVIWQLAVLVDRRPLVDLQSAVEPALNVIRRVLQAFDVRGAELRRRWQA